MATITASLPKTLAGVTTEVKRCLDAIQSNSMRAGRLLQSAKDMFESGNEWLAWAKNELGLSKAQLYKLVKVYTVFGGDARFEGVAMRVLYVLASEANADQIELAAKAAEEKMLDTAFVNKMLHPEKAAPAPVSTAPAEQVGETKKEETSPEAPAAPKVSEPVAAPESDDSAPWDDAPAAPVEAQQAPAAPQQSADNAGLMELVAEIKALREQLANKDALIMQLQSQKQEKPALPTMPHLFSSDFRIVLGVDNEDKIFMANRARDLLKMFKGNKEACDLIAKAAKAAKEA